MTDETTPQPQKPEDAASLSDLAKAVMPPGYGALVANIDRDLQAAQKTIQQSLNQSNQLIQESMQVLQVLAMPSTENSAADTPQAPSADQSAAESPAPFTHLHQQVEANMQAAVKHAEEALASTMAHQRDVVAQMQHTAEQNVQAQNQQAQARIEHEVQQGQQLEDQAQTVEAQQMADAEQLLEPKP